jgi:hypothetical protein
MLHKYLSSIESYRDQAPEENSRTTFVVIDHEQQYEKLGVGRKRKLMALFAEYFDLPFYFAVDDDMQYFTEYDVTGFDRRHKPCDIGCARNLMYMQWSMQQMICPRDSDALLGREQILAALDEEEGFSVDFLEEIMYAFGKEHKDLYRSLKIGPLSRINKIITNESKRKTIAQNPIPLEADVNEIWNKIRESGADIASTDDFPLLRRLTSDVSKLFKHRDQIGQAAILKIWDKKGMAGRSSNGSISKLKELSFKNAPTMAINMQRHAVVLHNTNAMKGVHPVSDAVLFERLLTRTDYQHMKLLAAGHNEPLAQEVLAGTKQANSEKQQTDFKSNQHGLELCRLGYHGEDAALIRYMLFQTPQIGGYQLTVPGYVQYKQKSNTAFNRGNETESECSGASGGASGGAFGGAFGGGGGSGGGSGWWWQ